MRVTFFFFFCHRLAAMSRRAGCGSPPPTPAGAGHGWLWRRPDLGIRHCALGLSGRAACGAARLWLASLPVNSSCDSCLALRLHAPHALSCALPLSHSFLRVHPAPLCVPPIFSVALLALPALSPLLLCTLPTLLSCSMQRMKLCCQATPEACDLPTCNAQLKRSCSSVHAVSAVHASHGQHLHHSSIPTAQFRG